MTEKTRKELEKHVKNVKETPKKVVNSLRREFKEPVQDGRRLAERIDESADKAGERLWRPSRPWATDCRGFSGGSTTTCLSRPTSRTPIYWNNASPRRRL